MNLFRMLLGSAVIFLAWAVSAQEKNATQDEMKSLQGIWQVTKWIDPEGKAAPDDEVKEMFFEFKKDRVVMRAEPLKFTLNPSKKPKWIDLDFDAAGIDVGVEMKGIYKLEGDVLTICVISGSTSGQSAERPTEFKTNKQKHHTLFVMKKVKK